MSPIFAKPGYHFEGKLLKLGEKIISREAQPRTIEVK